jgi:Ca2+-binding RTX toxin-like protein
MTETVQRVGEEFQVNTEPLPYWLTGVPSITGLANGGFVVSWYMLDSNSRQIITAQVFDASGAKVGEEFQANTQVEGNQYAPTVSGLASGNFVVTWFTDDTAQDGSGYAIKAQIFDAAGVKLGSEFLVNTQAAGSQEWPTITGLANGGFVVTWHTFDETQDGSQMAVKAQIFDAAGIKIGGEFLVNTQTAGAQHSPIVTGLANGGFVVAWATGGPALKAQLFDENGTRVGEEFPVNTQALGPLLFWYPSITALSNGGFVVTWENSQATQDGSNHAVKAQVFDANGTMVGGELLVNTQTQYSQWHPTVAALPNGRFIISWATEDPAQDGSYEAVKAQIFDATGARIGGEFLVNTQIDGAQWYPTSAALANGDFVVSWATSVPGGPSGFTQAISAQIFQMPNAVPMLANPLADQSLPEDTAFSYQAPANAFTDADGDALSYSATLQDDGPLPAWLAFNPVTRTFSGTPPANFNGAVEIKVTASDGRAETSDIFTLTITPVNDAPVLASLIANQSSPEDQAWSFQLPANSFSDIDGDALSYSAARANGAALPGWLHFDAATRTFSGTPPANFNGTLNLKVTASDGPLSASDSFTLTIVAVNDAPTLANPLADQSSPEDTAFSYQVPANSFTDADGDMLTYAATLADGTPLPAWLTFTPASRTFSGTPPANFNGTLAVRVTASDGQLSINDVFILAVTPVNDPVIGSLTIDGRNMEGAVLAEGVLSLYDPDGVSGFITFQWLRDGETIEGATDFTYSLTADDIGHAIALRASFTDGGGTLESLTSEPTGPVAANGPPVIENVAFAIDENVPSLMIGTVMAEDPDGLPLTYSIVGGNAAGLFTIDPATGALSTTGPLDYESAASHSLVVEVSDGFHTAEAPVTVTVNDVQAVRVVEFAFTPGQSYGATGFSDPDIRDVLTYTSPLAASGGNMPGLTREGEQLALDANGDGQVDLRFSQFEDLFLNGSALVLAGDFSGTGLAERTIHFTGTNGSDSFDASGLTSPHSVAVHGGVGHDTLRGGAGDDTLAGGDGDDLLSGGAGTDTIDYSDSTAGVRVLLSRQGSPQNTLAAGRDTLTGMENVTGSDFGDMLGGDALDNRLNGGGGDDELSGGDGEDVLEGEDGTDHLIGETGDDTLEGGAGDDVLHGKSGLDSAFGGGGNDTIYAEIADGGTGDDVIRLVDTAHGGQGNDNIIDLAAQSADLFGDDGNDYLEGGDVNDRLDGGAGNDVLRGGAGKDIATGGTGADTFRFNNLAEFKGNTAALADIITDFSHAEGDRIVLNAIDAITGGADNKFAFIGTAAFSAAGQLRYQQSATNTFVSGDVDGDGTADFMIRLDGLHMLVAGDFVL